MSFEKFANWCLSIYSNKPLVIHIFLISLLSYLYLGVLTEITGGILGSIFSLFMLIPYLIFIVYYGVFVIIFHFINRTRAVISLIFIFFISLALNVKEVDNMVLSLLQSLLLIPIIVNLIYVWMAIVSIDDDKKEQYPTFKRWGRAINPFKKKKNNK